MIEEALSSSIPSSFSSNCAQSSTSSTSITNSTPHNSSITSNSSSIAPSSSVSLPDSPGQALISSTSQTSPHSSRSSGFLTFDTLNVSSFSPCACYLTAEAKINDISGIVLLDTGSGVTIISSSHWHLLGSSDSIRPYSGPEIQGPDGSSIGPEGQVTVQITMAGITVHHPAIVAKHFRHLILLGNDYMKSIGLVLDLQANTMWLRQHPDRRYSISSDLTQAGRIDVPVISTERRIIAPYHLAFVEVNVPQLVSCNSWDASITSRHSRLATANSLVRFTDRKSFVQIANCSSRQQHLSRGEHVALADLYFDDVDLFSHGSSILSSPPCSSLSSKSPMLFHKESSSSSSTTDGEELYSDVNHQKSGLSASLIASNSLDRVSCSLAQISQSPLTDSHHTHDFPIFLTQSFSSHHDISFSNHSDSLFSIDSNFLQSLDLTDLHLTNDQIDQLKTLLIKYHSCFRTQSGRTTLTRHHIDTGNTKPIKIRPYRVSPPRQQIISKHINQMLGDGIIEPATGPYAAPVTLQPKKDGSLRFCVDFRQLNSVTVRDVYPIPRIDDTLDQLQAAQYFTSLDLKSGFWQIELDDESRPKTAFITHAGLFQFKVMPFGLTNAPATFQRLMDLVLGGLKWSCALVYLDDIIVYSSTFQSHLQHLESVFERIQSSGLTLQISKCQFCKNKLKYLGHVVSQSGIEPDPAKIRAVQDYPIPTRLKDVRTFLGLTSYYRRFIKNYATIAEPLIALTRHTDHQSFVWTTPCQDAFLHLRRLLTEAPIISYPHFDQPFLLQLDASDVGISAILAQKLLDPDGIAREHVIGYASRTLSQIERRYSPTERECLAIVYGCNHFRPYLEGVRFTILTDHKALKWLHSTKDLNSRLARWAMQIAAYDVEIQHRPGTANANCDALSRAPVDFQSISTITTPPQDTISFYHIDDPGHHLLLDHFIRSLLPPSHFSIHLPLVPSITNVNSDPSTSFSALPFSPVLLANVQFGDNIQLYEDLRTAQWVDPDLFPILNYLQHQHLPADDTAPKILEQASRHRVVDGALFRVLRLSSPSPQRSIAPFDSSCSSSLQHPSQLRLVVPRSKICDLLALAHDHPTAAHLGRRKTLYRLSCRFTWQHMRRDVAAYVRGCSLCQQYKPMNQPAGGLMKAIVVREPWNTVGIDLTGPLPKTRRGNVYILVVIDYFTKWVELFPLPNTKSKTIAQLFLDEVICRFGFPVRLISDNGVQFLSSIFTAVCQSLGIKHQRTPLYHPQSNLCERVNRTIKPLLAALAHHDHKSWDVKLSQIAFALRTAPSESTDHSPAFLMFGRHPRQPLDLGLPSPPTSDIPPTTDDLSTYRQQLLDQLLPAYSTTRELLDIAHERQTRQYDRHHRPLEFAPGDLVWVTALSGIAMGKWRGHKLAPRYEGPYRVVQQLSSLTYTIEHTLTQRRLTPIHVNRLRPYYSFTALD